MVDVQSEAEQLFATYLLHWNAQNFEGVAECYSEPCVFVAPAGTVCLRDRKAFVEFLKALFSGLNENGFSHSTAGSKSAADCGNGTAILDVADVRRLKADGAVLETIDGHYVLKNTPEGWRFTVAVVCEPGWRER